jgi:hypothetical protein
MLAGVEKIASELQDGQAKPAAGEGGKKASKAQHVGSVNRKIIGVLAENVRAQADALTSAWGIARGQDRAAHAAICALACALGSTDMSQQGLLNCGLAPAFQSHERQDQIHIWMHLQQCFVHTALYG